MNVNNSGGWAREHTALSKLYVYCPVDVIDESDDRYERCHQLVDSMVAGVSEKEAHDCLNTYVARSAQAQEDVCVGLLVRVLTQPAAANKTFRDLALVNRDGFSAVINQMQYITQEKYTRMSELARKQFIWLIRELIRNSVTGTDIICWNLMRQVVGGDLSASNIWLIEALLETFTDFREWLLKFPFLVSSVIYCYLRVIEDHFGPGFQQLRSREVQFVVRLMRERFVDCLAIGRDFVRVLQHITRIPEIEEFWRDLLHNPMSLAPNFTGLLQLMQVRTSRRYLASRLTPEMEKKLVFFTSSVKFGLHKRYQDWLQKQYLSTAESQSLRCDFIRFIVAVIHPTNELLSSDIIPRWAVIGWLLTSCTSQVALANAKLALFFDWLFYDPERDNIMNIEPAVLVMHHSLRNHPSITCTLLDFMCRISHVYYPPLADTIVHGITSALRHISRMRVVASLSLLFLNAKIDRELRRTLKARFAEFCVNSSLNFDDMEIRPEEFVDVVEPSSSMSEPSLHTAPETGVTDVEESAVFSPPAVTLCTNSVHTASSVHPASLPSSAVNREQVTFSALVPSTPACTPVSAISAAGSQSLSGAHSTSVPGDVHLQLAMEAEFQTSVGDFDQSCKRLPAQWRRLVVLLRALDTNESAKKCDLTQKLCRQVCEEDSLSDENSQNLAVCLCHLVCDMFHCQLLPPDITARNLQESVTHAAFVPMSLLHTEPHCGSEAATNCLLTVLASMADKADTVPTLLLYYICVSLELRQNEMKYIGFSMYKRLCYLRNATKSLSTFLVEDLSICAAEQQNLLVFLVPYLYSYLAIVVLPCAELLNLVVGTVDARQMAHLIGLIVKSRLVLFKKDSFCKIIEASLSWETFEQYCLWQFVDAHDLTLEYIIPVIGIFNSETHSEIASYLTLMLKREEPCMELLRPLLYRPTEGAGDNFVCTILHYWVREYEEVMAGLISALINRTSLASNRARKRSSLMLPSTEQILSHLEPLRHALCGEHLSASFTHLGASQTPAAFWSVEEMQTALSVALSGCNDVQRVQFMELFALLDADDDPLHRTTRRARKAARCRYSSVTAGGAMKEATGDTLRAHGSSALAGDESDTSSEDDRPVRRNKRACIQVSSDSD